MRSSTTLSVSLAGVFASLLLLSPAHASQIQHEVQPQIKTKPQTQRGESRDVDLVIALDISGSMSGLLNSAKQRLWDIVNELGQAQPQPNLRVAIVSYGKPSYGEQNGYVKVNQSFTSDLDAVNQQLFSFSTSGGDEYVARAISTSLEALQWSTADDAMRIMFVAGNESATQDPQLTLEQVTALATKKGVVINTIYCGDPNDRIASGWQDAAQRGLGMYASIDQNTAAIAQIATPLDTELATLNQQLNETYVAFGKDGQQHQSKQREQDSNTAKMSAPAAASRAVTKGSKLYRNSNWDLVDALEDGKKLADIAEQELPTVMQDMDQTERQQYLQEKSERRDVLRKRVAEIAKQRQNYIAEAKAKQQTDEAQQGLDSAIKEGLREVATKQGFSFSEK